MLVLKAIAYAPGSPVLGTVDKLSESTSETPVSVSVVFGDPRREGGCVLMPLWAKHTERENLPPSHPDTGQWIFRV